MKIIILLGGNLGDSRLYFKKALFYFEEKGYQLIKHSSLFRSEAWGYDSVNSYLNQVLVLEKEENVHEILVDCLEIEKKLGRVRNTQQAYSDRPIDIDILYIDKQIITSPELILPHPRLHLRRFTLAPLAEVLPDFIHPILQKDHKSLLLLCEDLSKVEAIAE
jgi:2-amino-4-hydroxy-6-hydroxymethyldihydropteridine diphosphokinase